MGRYSWLDSCEHFHAGIFSSTLVFNLCAPKDLGPKGRARHVSQSHILYQVSALVAHRRKTHSFHSHLIVSISHSWTESELSIFPRLTRLEHLAFTEHNDTSPAEGNLFLIEALQRIPRAHLTHLSCSFPDAAYLRSTWPYLGEFPQLQELRLRVCSPASCARRPRLTRLALDEVRMPLLEEDDMVGGLSYLVPLSNLCVQVLHCATQLV